MTIKYFSTSDMGQVHPEVANEIRKLVYEISKDLSKYVQDYDPQVFMNALALVHFGSIKIYCDQYDLDIIGMVDDACKGLIGLMKITLEIEGRQNGRTD